MTHTKMFDKILLYFIAFVVLAMIGYTTYDKMYKKDIAYVDISKLVEGYKLKKDLEDVSGKGLYKLKGLLDSLNMAKKISQAPDGSPLDTQIARVQYAFREYYDRSNQDINKKIWDRLNPLIMQYGEEKHLNILIGANGAGSLLYANKTKDLTEDLTTYVNSKYEKAN